MERLQLYFFAFLGLGLCLTSANITPTAYNLQLYLDTSTDIFSGLLSITAKAPAGSPSGFTLHNDGLNISLITVTVNGQNIYLSSTTNATAQQTSVQLNDRLVEGTSLQVQISYVGKVSTEPTGLYSFTDSGKKFYLTNFYPTHARKAFPCVDEPGSLASYSVAISVPSSSPQPIGSTSMQSTTTKNGITTYQFATTGSIAPYSLFFTVGSWSNSYVLPVTNTSLWLYPSLSSKTNMINPYLTQIANETYFRMFMEMKTLSLNVFIAPSLLWKSYSGLNSVVLKSDIALLDLMQTTTTSARDNFVAMTYAFCKVPFGSYIHPIDWANSWLSESIPMYLALQALNEVRTYGSASNAWLTTIDEDVFANAWATDSPVVFPASSPTSPEDVYAYLKGVGVKKGAFVLKSMEALNQSASITEALYDFLINSIDQAVDTTQFIKLLSSAIQPTIPIAGKTLSDVILPMLTQPGYPLVSMSRSEKTLTMSKSSFSYSNGGNSKNNNDWLLPMTTTVPSNPNVTVYFFPSGANGPVSVSGTYTANNSVVMDVDGQSLMRSSYDAVSMSALKASAFQYSVATRTKLVSDAFAAGTAGYQKWSSVFNFLNYIKNETELAPWTAAISGLRQMWNWIYHTGLPDNDPKQLGMVQPFESYVGGLISGLYNTLGTQSSDADPKNPLRRIIVAAECDFGSASCITELGSQYQKLVAGSFKPNNDMYAEVLCFGLRSLNSSQSWQDAYKTYVQSGEWSSQALKNSHYYSLACPVNKNITNQFLTTIFTSSSFPSDQVVYAFKEIVSQPHNVDPVIAFFIQNKMKFSSSITANQQLEIVEALGPHLTVSNQITLLQNFLKSNNSIEPALQSALTAAIKTGQSNVVWITNNQNNVYEGLTGTALPTDTPPTTTPKHNGASTVTISFLAVIFSVALVGLLL